MDIANMRKKLEGRRKQLLDEQSTWRGWWSEVSDVILPDHGRYLAGDDKPDNDGTKRHSKILDSTATDAMDILASGMQSGLTSPARPWFRLAVPDPDMLDYMPVRDWLFQVEKLMRFIFARSNVYQSLHQTYMELGGFCTGAMAVLEDYDKVIRCRAFTAGEYVLGADERGVIDTMYRKFEMTAMNLVTMFGEDKVSMPVLNAFKNGNEETPFFVVHAIEPNDSRIVGVGGNRNMPFRSIYYEEKGTTDKILQVSGFESFPVLAPRWNVVGRNIYGVGPGRKILGDVKMLQKMQEKSLVAIDKAIEPPIIAPTAMQRQAINTFPGGVTYSNEMDMKSGLRPLYEVRPDIQSNEFKIERVQYAIRKGLYNDLFLMLQEPDLKRKPLTATEVAERHEEKLLMLGPVLERLHAELLDPLIDRTFEIMVRNNLVPPAPPEVQGVDLRVEYISLLAQAQKMVALSSLDQLAMAVGQMAPIIPQILDHFDEREFIEEYADGLGTPPKVLRDKKAVAAIQKARAEQQQAAIGMEQANQAAQAAKVMSETDTEKPSALAALLGGPQQ